MQLDRISNVKPRKRTVTRMLKLAPAIIVILIVLLVLLVPAFISSESGRRMILARINGAISGKADFADLSMGWFKGIRVANLSFNDDAAGISVEVDRVSTRPAYGSILTGTLALGHTVIDKPRVEINVQEPSAGPQEKMGEQSTSPGTSTAAALPIRSIDLVLNDGSLMVTDPKSGTVKFSEINSRVNLKPPGRRSDFDLRMAVARADNVAHIKAAGNVTTTPKSGWSLRGTTGDLTVEVNDLDLESLGPIFALAGVEVEAKGVVAGDVKGRIEDGRFESVTAGVKATNLDVAAAQLKGDRLRTAVLDVTAKLSQSGETISVETLMIESDWASATAAGTVPTSFKSAGDFLRADSGYNLKGRFNCDLAALAAQMPRTIGLKEGTQLTSGRLTGSVETVTGAGKKQLRADVTVAGLEGTVEGKKAALSQPINAEALISSDKIGTTFDKLQVSAPFASVNCSGRAEALKYDASVNLAKFQSELGQFVNIGQYQMAGEFISSGQVSVKEGKTSASGSSTITNLLLSSKQGQSASEPKAEISFALDVDSKNNFVAVNSMNANASLGRISVTGGVLPLNDKSAKPLQTTIAASNVDLAKVLPFAVLFGSLPKEMQLSGVAESTLSVTAEGDLYKIATDSTRIDGLRLLHPNAEKPFEPNEVTLTFEAAVDPNDKAINVRSFELESPQIKIKKAGFSRVTEGKTTTLAGEADLEYDWSAVSSVAAPYLPEGLTLEGSRQDKVTFRSEYPAAQSDQMLPNLNAQARLGFDKAGYMGLNFGPTDVDIQVQSGVLKIPPFTTTVNEGQFNFAGQADFKEEAPMFKIAEPMQMVKDIKINYETTNKLLKYVNPIFADVVDVNGMANFNCEQLAIPLKTEDKNKAVVIGTISMNKVRLQGSNLMGQILTTSGGDPRGTDMTVHPTRFVLQDGLLRYDDMQVDVGDNPVNFGGKIGLDKSLDMTVTLPYTTEGRTARVGRQTAGRRITLPLKGTVDAPELDLGKLMEQQLKGQLEEQLQKALEDLFK